MNNQYDDARQDAARSTPEPDNEPLSSRAHGAASAPIGKRRRHLIVRGEMHTRHTARRNTAQLCTACDAALWLQIWDLCADHHDPDHMAAEVRRIVLERAVRNSRERG